MKRDAELMCVELALEKRPWRADLEVVIDRMPSRLSRILRVAYQSDPELRVADRAQAAGCSRAAYSQLLRAAKYALICAMIRDVRDSTTSCDITKMNLGPLGHV